MPPPTTIQVEIDKQSFPVDGITLQADIINFFTDDLTVVNRTLRGTIRKITITTNCPPNIRPDFTTQTDMCGIWCTCRDGQVFRILTSKDLAYSVIEQTQDDVGEQYFTLAFNIKYPHTLFDQPVYPTLRIHQDELLVAIEFLRNNACKIELDLDFVLCL